MGADEAKPPDFPGKRAAGGGKQPTLRADRARKENVCEGTNSVLTEDKYLYQTKQGTLLLCPLYLDHDGEYD